MVAWLSAFLFVFSGCGPLEDGGGGTEGTAGWAVRMAMPDARRWHSDAALTYAYCYDCKAGKATSDWWLTFVSGDEARLVIVGGDPGEVVEADDVPLDDDEPLPKPITGWTIDSDEAADVADASGFTWVEIGVPGTLFRLPEGAREALAPDAPVVLVGDCDDRVWTLLDAASGEVLDDGDGELCGAPNE
jgi:hypothetical protein